VVLLTAVVAGLLITLLRARLTGRRLKPIKLKYIWLVFLSVIPQILLFQIPAIGRLVPDELVPVILVISQALLLVFVVFNIAQPGVWLLGMGLLANFLAIISNRGWMPISPMTVRRILPALPYDYSLVNRRLGLSKNWVYDPGDINFSRLADRFTLPGWSTYQVAYSVGDIIMAIGTIWLLWSLSDPEKETK
jgi:hypothetical protein